MKKVNGNEKTAKTAKRISLVVLLLTAAMAAFSPVQAQGVASLTTEHTEKSWTKKMFGRTEWTEVQHAYANPREICRTVEKNIRYVTEDSDTWSPAAQTWGRGRGDCEDFALIVQELCRLSGIDTKVHLYFPATGGREGHAVLVGEFEGKMWFSSNGSYEEVKSEKEVRQRVARMLSCKEPQLWGMKLSENDVAKYIAKSSAPAVATAAR